jgi:hypothetical protein
VHAVLTRIHAFVDSTKDSPFFTSHLSICSPIQRSVHHSLTISILDSLMFRPFRDEFTCVPRPQALLHHPHPLITFFPSRDIAMGPYCPIEVILHCTHRDTWIRTCIPPALRFINVAAAIQSITVHPLWTSILRFDFSTSNHDYFL